MGDMVQIWHKCPHLNSRLNSLNLDGQRSEVKVTVTSCSSHSCESVKNVDCGPEVKRDVCRQVGGGETSHVVLEARKDRRQS